MTIENKLCHCQLFEEPVCYQRDSIYLNAFIDYKNLRGFFLTAHNELQIQTYVNDINYMNLVKTIPKVHDFAVFDNHLFYSSQGKLIIKNLDGKYSDVELGYHQHFRNIDLYRHQKLCKDLNCQFMCVVEENYKAKCVCPPSLVRADNKCYCPDSDPNCLEQLCVGFLRKNKICLLKKFKCHGMSDSGDQSNEVRCSKICQHNEHFCKMKCLSKDIVCKNSINTGESYPYKYQPKQSIFIKTTCVGICFLVIWVVVMLSVLSHMFKKHRKTRIRPPVRLENPYRSVYGRDSEANNLPDLQDQAEPVMEVVEKAGEFESADA
ncbi:hypothetical protein RF11_09237 [Thelohanellus kitauei]|uniref:Uncharacterized protein n=1 Tax=Thelohanellus kitauei TaxID=669202 RepID=A0A0C2JPD3_THEKT|nr:hypothetical protein RF11_09237 [Thelohanellus kitauei]